MEANLRFRGREAGNPPHNQANVDRPAEPRQRNAARQDAEPRQNTGGGFKKAAVALAAVFAGAGLGIARNGGLDRTVADVQRLRLKNDVEQRYKPIGGVENAPQAECLKSLLAGNPVTNTEAGWFGDPYEDLHAVFDEARESAERYADKTGQKLVKMDPARVQRDKDLNVRLLSETERANCLVHASKDGRLLDVNGKQLTEGVHLLVIDKDGQIYSTPDERKGAVHHSTFLAGGPVKFAGLMVVGDNGKPLVIANASGHYKPSPQTLGAANMAFYEAGVDVRKTEYVPVQD